MTADPRAVAAGLKKWERVALLDLNEALAPHKWRTAAMVSLESKGLVEWSYTGRRITPLGRAVAAVLRETRT